MTPTTSTTYIYKIFATRKKLKNNFWTPMPIYINEIAQRTIIKNTNNFGQNNNNNKYIKKRGLWF